MTRVRLIGALCLAAAAAFAAAGTAARAATIVTVTAGKPAELAFRLSRTSAVPTGRITFRVANAGRRPHAFEICTRPVGSNVADGCAGKATRLIRPGGSATVTVTLRAAGRYEFLSTVRGEARAGMRGVLEVTTATPAAPAGATTTGAAPTPSPFGPTGAPCGSPQPSTVTVNAFEFGFTVSPSSVPCGLVTFVISDSGDLQHNFDVFGLFASRSGWIGPGETIRASQNFLPGTYQYYCDVTGHIAFGMVGTLVVTA